MEMYKYKIRGAFIFYFPISSLWRLESYLRMGAFDSRVGRLLDDPQQISYIDPVDRGAKPECRRPAATAGIGALTSRCFSPRFSLRIRASSTEERKRNQRQENPPHLSERLRRTLVFTADTSGAAPFVYLFVGLEFLFKSLCYLWINATLD